MFYIDKIPMKKFLFLIIILSAASCKSPENKSIALVDRYSESLDDIISTEARLDTIATGMEWSEGPVWVASENMLLFSDVPKNTIYKWTQEAGISSYLIPSGYTDSIPRAGESGSNGLTINKAGELVLSQHGDRRIAVMKSDLKEPKPSFVSIADNYKGKKLNSPNDVVQDSNGNYYFTDPPYGLANQERDSTKETMFQGVYKVTTDGNIYLLIDSLSRPNGIALSPDEKTLFVANSDPEKARWYTYELGDNAVKNGKIFYDATPLAKDLPGLPDGMKINKQGIVFATGPGGVFIFNPNAELLGKIRFDGPTSNCAFADNDKTLFVTADMNVVKITLKE